MGAELRSIRSSYNRWEEKKKRERGRRGERGGGGPFRKMFFRGKCLIHINNFIAFRVNVSPNCIEWNPSSHVNLRGG
jgi:hypothetical protein